MGKIKIKKTKKKQEEMEKEAFYRYYYSESVYQYQIKGVYHLIIDGKDVLDGLNADNCFYYPDGVYQTKTGKKLVNLKAIARKFEIQGKTEFKEALKDGKAKRFETFRFDDVLGEFVEAENALHVLNLYSHYAKNKQLDKIMEEIK